MFFSRIDNTLVSPYRLSRETKKMASLIDIVLYARLVCMTTYGFFVPMSIALCMCLVVVFHGLEMDHVVSHLVWGPIVVTVFGVAAEAYLTALTHTAMKKPRHILTSSWGITGLTASFVIFLILVLLQLSWFIKLLDTGEWQNLLVLSNAGIVGFLMLKTFLAYSTKTRFYRVQPTPPPPPATPESMVAVTA